jgi:hypothetical protein
MKTIYRWIVAIIILVVLLFIFLKKCNPGADVGYSKDSLQYWKNREGQAIASLKKKEIDFNVVTQGYLDSIASLHDTRAKDIREAVSVAMRGRVTIPGQGKTVIVYEPVEVWRDSSKPCPPQIKSLSEVFANPYYFVQAHLEASGDSSFVELQTFDTLHLVTKTVKEGGLFNRRNYIQVDVRNSNPYNVVEGLKVYRVPDSKPKKIGIGLQLGYGIGKDLKPTPYAGIGVSYSFIRF